MLKKILIWLVVISTAWTAVPTFALSLDRPSTGDDPPIVRSQAHPESAATDGRRFDGKAKFDSSRYSRQRHRFQSWRSLWLVLGLVVPCFVLSLSNRVARSEDYFFSRSAVFQEAGPPGDPQVTPVSHALEEEHDSPRYQDCFPPLFDNWLKSGGKIPVAKIADYPRIPDLDRNGGLLDTWRPNLLGIEVPDEWDFQNLINTDRPDFTDAPYTVGEGIVLLETGYTFRSSDSAEIHLDRQQLPESLLRFGVNDETELRIKWNGQVITDVLDVDTGLGRTNVGGDDLQLGVKYEVLQQEGWRPMVTFVGGAVVPTGTRGVSVNQVQPNAQFVLGWGLRRWLYLKGSTGVDFAKTSDVTHVIEGSLQEGPALIHEEENITQWHQSVSLLFQASPRVGGFLEWFSFFSDNAADNRASHYLDTGLYFYVTPNLQLDLRIGERVSNRVDTLFTGAGFSTRW